MKELSSSRVESHTQDTKTAKAHMALSEIKRAVPGQPATLSPARRAQGLLDGRIISINVLLAALLVSWARSVHWKIFHLALTRHWRKIG